MDSGRDGRVRVRRVYDPVERADGARVLVDRLWPRGLAKDKAHLDDWLKAVAPSRELREWYGHDPERFDDFAERYRTELAEPERAEALDRLRDLAAHGPLTLLTAVRDVPHGHVQVLADAVLG
ncbi:DUF488 domain-containing protein [Streptomyces tsukubensis]|uniref:MarR family transcriptional regulator n=1 Tax=Streptomyces tsukubensis TaxID=83656 RepID=A0A1V4AF31_9ACTN|nr:DUF488 family protein [Streptomyces tsukubensis]OON82177.1 MarR family transcriptional regulator [Streptomyces tsukubensis]QFR92664.1 DUF488 family protein [Streptomyces tsukubensis]